ncbi:hypothetical protein Raf01_31920 [Rugosimonospora africana]|uniref:Uncharacterized protein n=1 Tax=Rugosimonospora africana TaxID=556532 RepID=A0A8J3QSN4_9ACTN|nr:hypothetical protein Raf01_31920 [Rugosimonospora africana]
MFVGNARDRRVLRGSGNLLVDAGLGYVGFLSDSPERIGQALASGCAEDT